MLAELAAANAAFAIIKKTVQNSGDIMRAGKAIGDLMSAKEELQRRGNQKRARGVGGNDLQEFLALEEIKQREAEIKQMLILSGRPGLWRDYQKFCEEAKDGRAKARAKAIKRRKKMLEQAGNFGVAFIIIAGLIGVVIWGLWIRGAFAQPTEQMTTCRKVKCEKLEDRQTLCIFRGQNNTIESQFFDYLEFIPSEYQCKYDPKARKDITIQETLKAIRDSQK